MRQLPPRPPYAMMQDTIRRRTGMSSARSAISLGLSCRHDWARSTSRLKVTSHRSRRYRESFYEVRERAAPLTYII